MSTIKEETAAKATTRFNKILENVPAPTTPQKKNSTITKDIFEKCPGSQRQPKKNNLEKRREPTRQIPAPTAARQAKKNNFEKCPKPTTQVPALTAIRQAKKNNLEKRPEPTT